MLASGRTQRTSSCTHLCMMWLPLVVQKKRIELWQEPSVNTAAPFSTWPVATLLPPPPPPPSHIHWPNIALSWGRFRTRIIYSCLQDQYKQWPACVGQIVGEICKSIKLRKRRVGGGESRSVPDTGQHQQLSGLRPVFDVLVLLKVNIGGSAALYYSPCGLIAEGPRGGSLFILRLHPQLMASLFLLEFCFWMRAIPSSVVAVGLNSTIVKSYFFSFAHFNQVTYCIWIDLLA